MLHCTGKAKLRYYVFCTSTKVDSLNMWNYYLKNGKYQGYNIGISLEKMLHYIESLDLKKCDFWQSRVMYSFVFCKHFLEKNAKYFWRMLHLQIGESCKASAGSYSASYIAIADHI